MRLVLRSHRHSLPSMPPVAASCILQATSKAPASASPSVRCPAARGVTYVGENPTASISSSWFSNIAKICAPARTPARPPHNPR